MEKGENEEGKKKRREKKSETFHRTATRESYEFWKSIRNFKLLIDSFQS